MITLEKVGKKYKSKKVLENVSLEIKGGEFVFVTGASGAGKTTLIHALIGAVKIDSGRILIDHYDITKMNSAAIQRYRRLVGIVFQDYKLLPQKTVFENVAFALEVCGYAKNFVHERTNSVLKLTGLEDLRHNFPHELSGGESQRTAIARALVHDPDLLIADEPTGNLDPENTKAIMELFKKINKNGTTVIIATHNKAIVDSMGKRVITLDKGKLLSDK